MSLNPLKGEIAVPGTDLTLTYDVNALVLAEMALGKPTDAIVTEFEAMRAAIKEGTRGALNLTLMRALFWAGLQRHQDCTIEEAADQMPRDLATVRETIAAGLLAAFGAAEGEDSPRPPKKGKPSTG